MKFCRKLSSLLMIVSLQMVSFSVLAQTAEEANIAEAVAGDDQPAGNYDINQLALPSEVKNISKQGGAIYYSPSVKGKVLIPIHFWGQVGRAGLHYMPVDTSLINGISLAGGPGTGAAMDGITLTRYKDKGYDHYKFDLTKGGDPKLHDFKLRPGDTIFIEKDDFLANRSYYTSLIGVIATFLSTILLYRTVKAD
jgi:hypothetical protein